MLRALALNLPGHVTNKRALSPPCTVAQSTHVSHLTTSAQKHRNVPTCKYLPKGRGAPSVPQALPVPESDLIEVADEEKFNELRQMFKMADIDEYAMSLLDIWLQAKSAAASVCIPVCVQLAGREF